MDDATGAAAAASRSDAEADEAEVRGDASPLPAQHITLVASTRQPQLPGRPAAFRVRIPKLDAYFTGTGAPGPGLGRGLSPRLALLTA